MLDDHTMAAFISGTLSEEERREVIHLLLHDDEARDWLHMACEALAAAREEGPDPAGYAWMYMAPRPPAPGPDRPALRYAPSPPGFS
ncbi:MAG: hypothetical protein KatS3mg043_2113 [Rhodothermaceae bacterium]|nr:MAG: hypothetical protein KatS3mg043_2113 [Rhodothermaceae bacterium]